MGAALNDAKRTSQLAKLAYDRREADKAAAQLSLSLRNLYAGSADLDVAYWGFLEAQNWEDKARFMPTD